MSYLNALLWPLFGISSLLCFLRLNSQCSVFLRQKATRAVAVFMARPSLWLIACGVTNTVHGIFSSSLPGIRVPSGLACRGQYFISSMGEPPLLVWRIKGLPQSLAHVQLFGGTAASDETLGVSFLWCALMAAKAYPLGMFCRASTTRPPGSLRLNS
jgi:hypothetical protein